VSAAPYHRTLPALLSLLVLLACESPPQRDSAYRPTQSVLEVVSLLRLHVEDDTYRFPPARDFTGRNVFRASLARLESLEELYDDHYSSGYMSDVLLFAKARSLERITEYELAAENYARVEELDSTLSEPAELGREVCEKIGLARALEPDVGVEAERALDVFNERRELLLDLQRQVGESHFRYVVAEELERTDEEQAEYFAARQMLDPTLDAFALQQFQQLVADHPRSKQRNHHLLSLADLYADLSERYVDDHPPESLAFDPIAFEEYSLGATRLYEAVSLQDGAVEKLEASRKLEAFLAFKLGVYGENLLR